MSWYKSPIRPYDPVLEDTKDNEASRYYRDSFDGTGQDSRTEPPAQDASMWSALTNIMPITRGGLDRRWGYARFASTGVTSPTKLYSFQRDTDGLRTIVAPGRLPFPAYNEDGTTYNSAIFTPAAAPRMLNSRSYGYFFSGNAADLKKWDGSASGGVSKWGIDNVSTLVSLNTPANFPTTASGTGWSNPLGVVSSGGGSASYVLGVGQTTSTSLICTGFGLSIPLAAQILGISVTINGSGSCTNLTDRLGLQASLVRLGTPVGTTEVGSLVNGAPLADVPLGGTGDLWGTQWGPTDISATTFGVAVQAVRDPIGLNVSASYLVDSVKVSVTYLSASNVISVATGAAGSINLTVGRIYYFAYLNSSTGHPSDLSPASASTGPLTNLTVNLSSIPVSADPQVDSKVILATSDGGDPSVLYQVAIIPNATTTYSDNTAEDTLVLQQVWLYTDDFGNDFGLAGNTPPPNGKLCVKHKGRLWMAVGQNLYYSKSVADLTLPNGFIAGKYEEAWPLDNLLDISEGAETVSGLISSGQALFVGTQRHVRWITGDDPSNFSEPEIIHAEVGVLNQEVWQSVFLQGTPSGCIWLTPDYRVILSDFNSYQDIGHSIQDVLASINPNAAATSHAMFVSDGEFDLYILAVPTGANTTCDTHLVFNMRSQRWVVWQPNNHSLAMVFNVTAAGLPQWLFSTSGFLYQYRKDAFSDDGVNIPGTAVTSWLHLGAPTSRKLLDELEVVGDRHMLVSISGSSPSDDFSDGSLHVVKLNAPLVQGPFGQLKLYLASSGARDRYYRLTFSSSYVDPAFGTMPPFLRSYSLKSIPFNTL